MKASDRRNKIEEYLKEKSEPVSATFLAEKFSVSRQIIVSDIALLRASGIEVLATPRGYVLSTDEIGTRHRIVCEHDPSKTEEELQIIVDFGCRVIDVTVEHPIYGELTGRLDISSRYEISQFIEKLKKESAHSLLELTDGVHLHTIECPSEEVFKEVKTALKKAEILCE